MFGYKGQIIKSLFFSCEDVAYTLYCYKPCSGLVGLRTDCNTSANCPSQDMDHFCSNQTSLSKHHDCREKRNGS